VGTSEAYRVMRQRADAAWTALRAGAVTAAVAAATAVLVGARLPLCVWLVRTLGDGEGPGGMSPCWGLRLTVALCLGIAGTTLALLWRHWVRTAACPLLRRPRQAAPGPLSCLAADLGLLGRVQLVPDPVPWAVTHGLIRPCVAVSSGLLELLGPEEVAAVLAHERHHVLRRDPLRLWLARAVVGPAAWVPGVRGLLEAFATASELAADAFAMEWVGRRALASALERLAAYATGGMTPAGGLGVLGPRDKGSFEGGLAARVAQIAWFPRALPSDEDPWRRVGLRWSLWAFAGTWAALAGCALSLALH
jgi:Zn-dependent protease with chaperone function